MRLSGSKFHYSVCVVRLPSTMRYDSDDDDFVRPSKQLNICKTPTGATPADTTPTGKTPTKAASSSTSSSRKPACVDPQAGVIYVCSGLMALTKFVTTS